MKKLFAYALAATTLNLIGMSAHIKAFEIPTENISNISLPQTFAFRKLYKSDCTIVFKTDDIIFAQGRFNKKFTLKTPYGKHISVARIYELVPSNSPLLVIRDHNGFVLGFVEIEHYRPSELFKRTTGTVYASNGTQTLKFQYPLASDHFVVYFIDQGQSKLLASTKSGKEGDTLISFHADYQDLGIDSTLMLSLLQIHASKSVLAHLGNYIAIDDIDIDELAAYALETEGEKEIKSIPLDEDQLLDNEEISRWQALKDTLIAHSYTTFVAEDEKEELATTLANYFDHQSKGHNNEKPHHEGNKENPHHEGGNNGNSHHEGGNNGNSHHEGSNSGNSSSNNDSSNSGSSGSSSNTPTSNSSDSSSNTPTNGSSNSSCDSSSIGETLLSDLERAIDALTGKEKAVLAEMIGNRLGL